jgi:ribosomal protein S17E
MQYPACDACLVRHTTRHLLENLNSSLSPTFDAAKKIEIFIIAYSPKRILNYIGYFLRQTQKKIMH